MKKSIISIIALSLMLSLIAFNQPAFAAEPNTINLSDLEDDQILELQEDTILNIDTDKRLTKITLTDCDLTIEGNGTLTLGLPGPDYWDNLVSTGSGKITINSGSIIAKKLEGNFIINGGNISIPNTGPSFCNYSDDGYFIMNGGEVDISSLNYPGENSTIAINGGHLKLHFVYDEKIDIGDNECSMSMLPMGIEVLPRSEFTPVEGISFDKSTYTLIKYDNVRLDEAIKFYPENATNKKITWTTSDPSILNVYEGDVLGVGYGTATVTATTEDGNFSASCEVTVEGTSPSENNGLRLEFKEIPRLEGIKFNGVALEKGKDYFIRYDEATGLYNLDFENFAPKN